MYFTNVHKRLCMWQTVLLATKGRRVVVIDVVIYAFKSLACRSKYVYIYMYE